MKRKKKKPTKKLSSPDATSPIKGSSKSKPTKDKSSQSFAKIIEDLDKVFGFPLRKTKMVGMRKGTPSSDNNVVYNDEQFEAHCLDSLSKDMSKWNIPWFVGVIGKPNSDDVKIIVAGKPATIDKDESVLYMKSLITLAAMTLEQTLKDKDQGYDIIDS